MTSFQRRGACPSLAEPMPTGDGLLLRLTPPWGGWPPAAMHALAAAAEAFGNGVLEITARGNLQVRGFRPDTVRRFAEALARAGLVEGPATVSPSPLAGEDPREIADPRPIAAAILDGLAALTLPLAPKVSVIVDGGGLPHLQGQSADVRLQAQGPTAWHIWAGPAYLGVIPAVQAAATALRLLQALAECQPGARMRDLIASDGLGRLRQGIADSPPPSARQAVQLLGFHALRGGAAFGIAGPFGTMAAPVLAALARAASDARALRPAPDRVLLALGLAPRTAKALLQTASELGLVTSADDPRRRIAACPGAPVCASAECATRPLAEALASPAFVPPGTLHVSGCAKGCAHPGPAPITLVGHAGTFGLIRHGTARCTPTRYLPPEAIPAALEHLA